MFWKRFLSAIVLIIVILSLGFLGGPTLAAFLGVISVIGYLEFTKATKVRLEEKKISALEKIGVCTTVFYYLVLFFSDMDWKLPQSVLDWVSVRQGVYDHGFKVLLFVLIIGFICMLAAYVFLYPKYNIQHLALAYFGIVYVSVLLSFIYFTRELTSGIYFVWLIFIAAWASDTCAYAIGVWLGKHKLTPKLSPKKSIEGAIGGVVGTTIAGGLYGWIFAAVGGAGYSSIFAFAIIGFFGSIVSQCGDLTASAIKRNSDIKDFGKIIPGHGGILDRFDSVIVTAPLVYFLLVLLCEIR